MYIRDHSFSIYAKFPEKLTFVTPSYAREITVFQKILSTYEMDDSYQIK